MTDTSTLPEQKLAIDNFLRALTLRTRLQINHTARLSAFVVRAVRDQGWTVEQLVEHCAHNHGNAMNPAGIVMFRLEWCADNPPPNRSTGTTSRPFCSKECEQRRGQIEDPKTGNPVGWCECRGRS